MNDTFVVRLDDVLKDMCDHHVSEASQAYVRAAIRALGPQEVLPKDKLDDWVRWYDREFSPK